MSPSRTVAPRSLFAVAALSGFAWVLLGAAFAAQLVFSGSFTWESAIRISIRDWLPWALLSPGVFALAIVFPLERGHWIGHLPVHLGACLLSVIACEWLGHALRPESELNPPPGATTGSGGRRGPSGRPPAQGLDPLDDPRPGPGPGPRMGPGPERGPGYGPGMGPNFGTGSSSKGSRSKQEPPPGGLPGLPGGALSARARLNVPVYWVVVCGAHALMFYRRSQDRERRSLELAASLAQAKLQALRMQLQPHFLFNTLNAISTLVHRDANAADEMIGNLSDFLRLTLEHADQQEIPLREELEFVRRYLAIEQVRFGERLKVEIDVAGEFLAIPVPALILQPLVENALRHGLEPKTGGGLLRLTAERSNGWLQLSVIDNGRGLPATPPQRTGIGVANTRERLRERYGAGSGAGLDLTPATGGGTAAVIRIPISGTAAESTGTASAPRP